jgi:hypothetical protein
MDNETPPYNNILQSVVTSLVFGPNILLVLKHPQ